MARQVTKKDRCTDPAGVIHAVAPTKKIYKLTVCELQRREGISWKKETGFNGMWNDTDLQYTNKGPITCIACATRMSSD